MRLEGISGFHLISPAAQIRADLCFLLLRAFSRGALHISRDGISPPLWCSGWSLSTLSTIFPFNLARISPVAACPHFLSYFFSPSGKWLGSAFSITIHQEPKDCVLLPAFILLCLRLLSPSRLRGSLDVLSLTSLRPVCHTALPCPGKLCTGHRTPDVHTTDG